MDEGISNNAGSIFRFKVAFLSGSIAAGRFRFPFLSGVDGSTTSRWPGWITALMGMRFQMSRAAKGTSNFWAIVERLSPSCTR